MNKRSKADRETDEHIMRTALVCLIVAVEQGKADLDTGYICGTQGLRPGINVERIREVYQNLPQVDEDYLSAKKLVERAAEYFKDKIPVK